MTISENRNFDLSIYYWLKSIFTQSWITVTDAFPVSSNSPDTPFVLPVISIDAAPLRMISWEIGACEIPDRSWTIDVFGKDKSQRDEFSYTIVNNLIKNIPVYDYNAGFPSAVQTGVLIVENIRQQPVYTFRDLVKELYWRSNISFTTIYQASN